MSERLSKGNVEDRKLKRKMEEEPPTLTEEDSNQPLLSLKPVYPSNNQVQGENQLCCKFCNKKFRNCQALGGHQNAHKRERLLLNIEKKQEINALGFAPNNVHLYPYSLSSMSNLPLQGTPFSHYHGALMHHMTHMPNLSSTLAPPGYGIHQVFSLATHRFGMTSSWGRGDATFSGRLNPEIEGFSYPIPSLAESASRSLVGGTSSPLGADFGGLRESPSVSTNDSPSADLDLSLKL